ncbi:GNAT family acetyltransferase [candidate division WOR-3 bacterium]|nr:GNAT family acetyltransferase [candidate division WOR-3 bacterium]
MIEDTDQVLEVWSLAGITTPQRNPRADLQKKLRHSPESFFVGSLDGKVVATVMVGYDGHRGWIYALAVKPDLQRKGIGRQMMEQAESWLRQQGCLRVKLQVDEPRGDVVGFYKKLGYEVQPLVSMAKWFRVSEDRH